VVNFKLLYYAIASLPPQFNPKPKRLIEGMDGTPPREGVGKFVYIRLTAPAKVLSGISFNGLFRP
jgi:hypothetical protein